MLDVSLPANRLRRRWFVLGVLALCATRATAQQSGRVYRVGLLTARPQFPYAQAFEEGLREHGYVVGRNLEIVQRHADPTGSFSEAARELVRANVDVIVTGVNPSTDAVRQATSTIPIPIVMLIGTNVIAAGYARTLAKPDGNITGFLWDATDIPFEKRLELLKEAVPSVSRIAVFWEPPYAVSPARMEKASSAFGVTLFPVQVSGELESDFAEILRGRADALYIIDGTRVTRKRPELAALALRHRLPTMSSNAQSVDAGCLMSYSPNLAALVRSSARHIDKILRGVPAGDIPIEQPAVLELVINLKTAKTLGLTIPKTTLLRAERVIP
jgi:putative ABC transport system substrate-binding protein